MATDAAPVAVDQFLVTLAVPRDLPDAAVAAIRQTLDHPAFAAALHRLADAFVRRFPTLAAVAVAR